MTTNPLLNAAAAAGYIVLVVCLLFFSPQFESRVSGIIVPITMLALLVFSVLMQAYFFFYTPVQLYLGGERERAVRLCISSIALFGAITFALLCAVLGISWVAQ